MSVEIGGRQMGEQNFKRNSEALEPTQNFLVNEEPEKSLEEAVNEEPEKSLEEVVNEEPEKSLEPKEDAVSNVPGAGEIYYVKVINCDAVNIRKEPSLDSEPVTVQTASSIMRYLGEAGDFKKVLTASGICGYCMSSFLSEKTTAYEV